MSIPQRSARDQLYINSTSFEVYIITGLVFLFGFTLSFILSVVYHVEVMVWPGSLLTIILSYVVLNYLSRRERASKIREVDGE